MKKAVSLFLALALMVASLAGCGSANSGSTDNGSAGSAASEEGEVFKIGGIGPVIGGVGLPFLVFQTPVCVLVIFPRA